MSLCALNTAQLSGSVNSSLTVKRLLAAFFCAYVYVCFLGTLTVNYIKMIQFCAAICSALPLCANCIWAAFGQVVVVVAVVAIH